MYVYIYIHSSIYIYSLNFGIVLANSCKQASSLYSSCKAFCQPPWRMKKGADIAERKPWKVSMNGVGKPTDQQQSQRPQTNLVMSICTIQITSLTLKWILCMVPFSVGPRLVNSHSVLRSWYWTSDRNKNSSNVAGGTLHKVFREEFEKNSCSSRKRLSCVAS